MAGLQSGDEIISMNGEQVMSLSLLLLSPHGMLQEFWGWGGKPSVPADFPSRLASQTFFCRPGTDGDLFLPSMGRLISKTKP